MAITGSPAKHDTSSQESSEKVATIEAQQPPKQIAIGGTSEPPHEDVPPNGGYGWVCVACVATINAHTWGINSSYGVFLAYFLANNIFPGATYLDFAFVGGLSISIALLVSPLATTTTRLFGTRTSLLIGVFLQTVALLAASFAKETYQLFLSQGVCFGAGMGFLFVASVGIAPQWFTTRRSLANALGAAGSGLGGLTYSLATNAMLRTLGLGWAFRILAIISCAVNTACALTIRDRNHAVGGAHKAFDFRLLLRLDFVCLLAWGFFSMLGYIVLLFSLPNYASSVGLTAAQGSVVGAILNLGQGLGRPPIGYFSDSVGRLNMAVGMTLLSGVFAFAIWIPAKSYGVLIFFALVGGSVAGTFWATVAPVTAEVVGLRELPTALSMVWLALVLPCTFSEPIALEIASRTSAGYLGTQVFAGVMYFVAAGALFVVRTRRVRLGDGGIEKEKVTGADDDGRRGNEMGRIPLWRRLVAWQKL